MVFQGSKTFLHFAAGAPDQVLVETAEPPRTGIEPGSVLELAWSVADTLIYPADDAP